MYTVDITETCNDTWKQNYVNWLKNYHINLTGPNGELIVIHGISGVNTSQDVIFSKNTPSKLKSNPNGDFLTFIVK